MSVTDSVYQTLSHPAHPTLSQAKALFNQTYYPNLDPKSETPGFDSWLTPSLRIECNFPLASSDVCLKQKSVSRTDGVI